jgi:hypothetical protein
MNELYIGTGKRFAQELIADRRARGSRVFCISAQDGQDTFQVNWSTVTAADIHKIIRKLPSLDVVLFNQNASSLSAGGFKSDCYPTLDLWRQVDHWQQSYFVSCQLPFYLIHSSANKISPNTKIGWMLSELVNSPVNSQVGYADYIGYKFTNTCIMRSFSLNFPACFFGIIPGSLDRHGLAQDLIGLIHNTDVATLNGGVFNSDGSKFEIGHQNT